EHSASHIMSGGSLSQFSPNLQQPIPTMATLSRIASGLPMTRGSYDPRRGTASLRRCVGDERAARAGALIPAARSTLARAVDDAHDTGFRDEFAAYAHADAT